MRDCNTVIVRFFSIQIAAIHFQFEGRVIAAIVGCGVYPDISRSQGGR